MESAICVDYHYENKTLLKREFIYLCEEEDDGLYECMEEKASASTIQQLVRKLKGKIKTEPLKNYKDSEFYFEKKKGRPHVILRKPLNDSQLEELAKEFAI